MVGVIGVVGVCALCDVFVWCVMCGVWRYVVGGVCYMCVV